MQAQRDIITSDFDKSTPYGDRRQVCPALPAMMSCPKGHGSQGSMSLRGRTVLTDLCAQHTGSASCLGSLRHASSQVTAQCTRRGRRGHRTLDPGAQGRWGMQEIVFIGAGMKEEAICKQLDGALLTDEELQKYNQKWNVQFL